MSLICATAGRVVELRRLLDSLEAQTFRDFDLTIVDQNMDDRVLQVVGSGSLTYPIKRLRLSPPGLCRALNAGLKEVNGEIIGFPDDDCWYTAGFLDELSTLFSAHPDWDGITTPAADEHGRPSIARWGKRATRLTRPTVGMAGCCTTMFYRRQVCQAVGLFDPTIGGEGSLLSPGSDMDYLHRVNRAGFHIEYQPHLAVGHPQTLMVEAPAAEVNRKRYSYAYGEGSIVRKYSVPLWYVFGIMLCPLARAITNAILGHSHKARLEWLTFRGRVAGWAETKPVR